MQAEAVLRCPKKAAGLPVGRPTLLVVGVRQNRRKPYPEAGVREWLTSVAHCSMWGPAAQLDGSKRDRNDRLVARVRCNGIDGCSSANATTACSTCGSARFFRFGFLREISANPLHPVS